MKQNKESLISVIVPVYNEEKYLRKCLDSIRNQTYTEIEVICVDDHSTDSSGVLCDQYAEMDSRFCVIHKEKNGGLSEARNTGMKYARGEYLSFVDADDWIDGRFLECLYHIITQYHGDIAQCGYANITNEAFHVRQPLDAETVIPLTGKQALKKLYSIPAEYASVPYTIVCNKLYKRSIFFGLYFPKGRMYEDQFFTYRCFDRAKKILVSTERLYYYRQSSGSITRSTYTIRFQDDIIAHGEQIRYFQSRDRDFSEVVVARIIPLCIQHYLRSEFDDDTEAKKSAYCYMFQYLIPYLRNRKVSWKNKGKVLLFLLCPEIFRYYDWNIQFYIS